jgi:hypothetical protein
MMLRLSGTTALRIVRGFTTANSAKLPPTFFEDEMLLRTDLFYRFQREWRETRNIISQQIVAEKQQFVNRLTLSPAHKKRADLLKEVIMDLSANEKELFSIMLSRRAKEEVSKKSELYNSSGSEYQQYLEELSRFEDNIQEQIDPKSQYKKGLLNALFVHPDALAELAGKVQNDQAEASSAQAAKTAEATKVEEAPQVGRRDNIEKVL